VKLPLAVAEQKENKEEDKEEQDPWRETKMFGTTFNSISAALQFSKGACLLDVYY
jgi:hypothetical protein